MIMNKRREHGDVGIFPMPSFFSYVSYWLYSLKQA